MPTSTWARRQDWPIPEEAKQLYAGLATRFYDRILDEGMSSRSLAKQAGCTQRTAANLLRMVKAKDPRLQQLLDGDEEVVHTDVEPRQETGNTLTVEHSPSDVDQPVITWEQFIEATAVDLDTWEATKWRPGSHAVTMKVRQADGTDKPVTKRLWSHRAEFRRRAIPLSAIPDWQPIAPRTVAALDPTAPQVTLVIPDIHFGYRWGQGHAELIPTHDRRCLDIALQVARRHADAGCLMRVILLGDNLDLPGLSRHESEVDTTETTEPTLRAAHGWLASLRHAVGSACPITYLEGNHEKRVRAKLEADIPEFARLRIAADDTHPHISVPKMLGLDILDIEYAGPYGVDWWHPDVRLVVQHGNTVKAAPGATAAALLKNRQDSIVCGHTHRLECVNDVVRERGGNRVISAATAGTFARLDGVVPAGSKKLPGWQQGFVEVWTTPASEDVQMATHLIRNGRCIHGRALLVGEDYAEQEAEWTGYDQVARGLMEAA